MQICSQQRAHMGRVTPLLRWKLILDTNFNAIYCWMFQIHCPRTTAVDVTTTSFAHPELRWALCESFEISAVTITGSLSCGEWSAQWQWLERKLYWLTSAMSLDTLMHIYQASPGCLSLHSLCCYSAGSPQANANGSQSVLNLRNFPLQEKIG